MLAFMRKYQKYFYAVITCVIIISFSFFGTYNTLAGNSIHEQIAFTTVSGETVSRSALEEMATFIGTDTDDKNLFGGIWGPNFLNDGVIRKDFLDTGLAALLIQAYSSYLEEDFKSRANKEAHYQLYTHPQAKFISSKTAWSYFAPEILTNYQNLIGQKDPLDSAAIQARISLYLAERRFPAPYLQQVLKYQERENKWVPPDEMLNYTDLSLFGYHTLEDWFGSRFNHLIAEFIFNAASIAEERGYQVTRDEVLASLVQNAQESFRENRNNPRLGVNNPSEYMDQQLLRMRLDKTKAVKLWQKVLLFRRLFNDVGQSVFVDALPYKTFNQFAEEVIIGDLYRLPAAMKIADFPSLQRFEVYLNAISKRSKEEKESLILPLVYLAPQEVAKKTPELVYKNYELEIASIHHQHLLAKASVKDTLNWEIDEKNWDTLKTQFPELGLVKASTKEERLNALDRLDATSRAKLDQFAREELVSSHPEWLQAALNQAPKKKEVVKLPLKGPSRTFTGLEQGEDLIILLDKAQLGELDSSLSHISFDEETYYQIKVIDRKPGLELLSYEESTKSGILDTLVKRALDIHYVQIRSQNPADYQNNDKTWKPLEGVQNQVALSYFKSTLDAIKESLKGDQDKEKYQNIEGERLAPYRFVAYVKDVLNQLKKNPSESSTLVVTNEAEAQSIQDQFKLRKSPLQLSRKSETALPNSASLFKQDKGWSEPQFSMNGDVYIAFIAEKKQETGSTPLKIEQVTRARFLLGNDAKRAYLHTLLPLLKERNAISFDYLYVNTPSMEQDV